MLFAPLLKKFAPSDTYTVWKRDMRLRVDGTLVGLSEEEAKATTWKFWKRGHFSLLVLADTPDVK
eukprot:3725238-Pyramimonas_sp.AAC.1